jgi:carboxynorspermidine decarboxylase
MPKQSEEAALPGNPSWVDAVDTPAFVIDEPVVHRALGKATQLRERSGFRLLYALKPLATLSVLELLKPHVDGFAASSLFEARLARSVVGDGGTVHITTPGFRAAEIPELNELCDYMTFNSLEQYERFSALLDDPIRTGLRINPQLALLDDDRYNPCRKHSKLGVPLKSLAKALLRQPNLLRRARGVQFHTNCDSPRFSPLLKTVRHIEKTAPRLLENARWINVGGGYLFDDSADFECLTEAVHRLRSRFGLEVFFEPGAALVREAGFLVSEVIDLFARGRAKVAVLDTSVNHLPEVFEYQFEPDVAGHDERGEYEYLLAGSTCLAGDLFGRYLFPEPLKVGARVVFQNVGAYSMVKAHMFNGINLPSHYSVSAQGELKLQRRFDYSDFLTRCGATIDALV